MSLTLKNRQVLIAPFPQLPGAPRYALPKSADALKAMSSPQWDVDDDKGTKNSSRARDGWGILQQEKSRVDLEIGITGLLSPLDDGGDQNAHR